MARVQAVLAHGLECDRCGEIVQTAHERDRAPGYYIAPRGLIRVTDARKVRTNLEEIYVCSKDCLLDLMKYQISQMTETQ